MFDLPFKLLPPGLVFGGALYAGVCALWLQPLVESRLAEKTYILRCEEALYAAAAESADQAQRERDRVNAVLGAYRELMGPLAALPGMERVSEMTDDLMERQRPDLPRASRIDQSSHCGCAVASAFEANTLPMLWHVMSLRTYEPAILSRFDQAVAQELSGRCGTEQ